MRRRFQSCTITRGTDRCHLPAARPPLKCSVDRSFTPSFWLSCPTSVHVQRSACGPCLIRDFAMRSFTGAGRATFGSGLGCRLMRHELPADRIGRYPRRYLDSAVTGPPSANLPLPQLFIHQHHAPRRTGRRASVRTACASPSFGASGSGSTRITSLRRRSVKCPVLVLWTRTPPSSLGAHSQTASFKRGRSGSRLTARGRKRTRPDHACSSNQSYATVAMFTSIESEKAIV